MAGSNLRGEEVGRDGGISGADPHHPRRAGEQGIELPQPLAERSVQQVVAIDVQEVEEARRQGSSGPESRRIGTGCRARAGDLKRLGSPVWAHGNRLPVEDQSVAGQPADQLDDLGKAVRYLLQ